MHSLICGPSECGKTTLAKQICKSLKPTGWQRIVLTPVYDDWGADAIFEDPDEFIKVFWNSENCFVFIDEAADSVGRYDDEMRKTATRGRHFGHSCFYIVQQATLINKAVRGQCSQVFLFNSPLEDCELLAKSFNNKGLLEAETLKRGEYLRAQRFGKDGIPTLSRGIVDLNFAPK